MAEENYLEKLMQVKEEIKGMLDFEQRALERFGKPPVNDEKRMVAYRDYN